MQKVSICYGFHVEIIFTLIKIIIAEKQFLRTLNELYMGDVWI